MSETHEQHTDVSPAAVTDPDHRIEEAETASGGQDVGRGGRAADPVELRAMSLVDVETVAAWVDADPSILANLRFPEGSTSFALRNFLVAHMARQDCWWVMARRGADDIAAVGATDIKPDGSAHVHVVVSPKHRGGRTLASVLAPALDIAFNQMGLTALLGVIVNGNRQGLAVAKKLGFQDMGLTTTMLTRTDYLEREA